MKMLKNLAIAIFTFLPFFIQAQGVPAYTVHIGTFVNPKPADFEVIRDMGFIYTQKQDNGYTDVLMGGYPSRPAAQRMADEIKTQGYQTPFATKLDLESEESVTVIQIGVENATKKFVWGDMLKLNQLYVLLNQNQVKVVTGIYPDVETAKKQLTSIREMGFKDAFVKNVNRGLLHSVGEFERWGEKKALIPLDFRKNEENLAADERPKNYDDPIDIIPKKEFTSKGVKELPKATFTANVPDIRADVKRNSAYELQTVLKTTGNYKSSLDGYYGRGTRKAYDEARKSNRQIQKYWLLAQHTEQTEEIAEPGELQYFINHLWDAPESSVRGLEASNAPIAKAYRAYFEFVNNGIGQEVNTLMNASIKEAFAGKRKVNIPRFDHTASYAYNDLDQLLQHLCYIHDVSVDKPEAPCWLFQKHPGPAMRAFDTKGASNFRVQNCGGFWEWEEIQILNAIVKDLDARADFDEDKLANAKAMLGRLYLTPQITPATEASTLNTWNDKLWKGINGWALRDPMLQDLSNALKITYFQSYVLLEDYFMDEGFNEQEAKGMALKALFAITGYHLDRFV